MKPEHISLTLGNQPGHPSKVEHLTHGHCTCPTPDPQPITLFGWIDIIDVYECNHCHRKIP